jgi:hypothetical protein
MASSESEAPWTHKRNQPGIPSSITIDSSSPGNALAVQNNIVSHLDHFAELLLKLGDGDAARNAYGERFSAYVRLVDIRRQTYMRAGRT